MEMEYLIDVDFSKNKLSVYLVKFAATIFLLFQLLINE